ncbi:MAG: MlaD family protein [Tepidisphaeraceae bacterium]|jgi:paraquat-inducible protein B
MSRTLSPAQQSETRRLPKPVVKPRNRLYLLVWAIPLLALVAAGVYYYIARQERGPVITIQFNDATGLKEGETPLLHLGVPIGKVTEISLSADDKGVVIHAELLRGQDAFVRQGAQFWVVRPEISEAGISGLSTVMSGPFIDTVPGQGDKTTQFTGLDKAPVTVEDGLKIILYSDHLQHLQPDSPVYFRGIQVGVVQWIRLSDDATRVNVEIIVQRRYADLVRSNSQFWMESGAEIKGGIFTGIDAKLDSLRALISGGVAFATQDSKTGDLARDGAEFPLNDDAKKEWLAWSTPIPITPHDSGDGDKQREIEKGQDLLQSAVKSK